MLIPSCTISLYIAGLLIYFPLTQAGGTIEPFKPFDAAKDAEAIHSAVSGPGTNNKKLIDTITMRSNKQRQQIAQAYKDRYKKDVIKDIKGDTSGTEEEALVALMTAPAEYDASQIRKAIKGIGTDFSLLIEILLTRTPQQLQAIADAYKRYIVNSIKGDTSGKVEDLLVQVAQASMQKQGFLSLLKVKRDPSSNTDPEAAKKDAEALLKAGTNNWFGTNDKTFTNILTTRNFAQLRLIFDQYNRIAKKSIEEAIKSETSGEYQKALLTLVDVIQNPGNYFATRMHDALKGIGTNDNTLIRISVTRSEVDMEEIKKEYMKKYKKSLEDAVRGDVSGNFQNILVNLIKGNQKPL